MTQAKSEKPEKQDKLVYFNRAEVQQLDGEAVIEVLEKRDDDELFRLREVFEKTKKTTTKIKEVRK